MSSKSTPKRSENPAAKPAKPARSREHGIAAKANDFHEGSFGAPVTSLTVAQVERALKKCKFTRAHFIGASKDYASAKQLDDCAKGRLDVRALPPKTRANIAKLTETARDFEKSDGRVPKLWAKKVAITLRAILNDKPARKRAPKPATPAQTTIQASVEPSA
jgi:hypothetical protein